jgi:diadenosine tetraphosphate (Ap4A) HIT family hydrolase
MAPEATADFLLHPRLAQDCVELARLPLCRLLLMKERRYPWLILVPQRPGVTEIFQLPESEQQQLLRESSSLARSLMAEFAADKLNIAAIGNLVPQLHLHHVLRYRHDPAWPGPVWGRFTPEPYAAGELQQIQGRLRRALSSLECTWTAG